MGDGTANARGFGTLPTIVSDSSALIALAQIDRLALLGDLFAAVMVPPAVAREIAPTVVAPPWLVVRPLARGVGPRILRAALGPGEIEAIALALELGRPAVILDERSGRRFAEESGLAVIGTVGILLQPKRRGLLAVIRPDPDALVSSGFYLSQRLYRQALVRAGEGSERVEHDDTGKDEA